MVKHSLSSARPFQTILRKCLLATMLDGELKNGEYRLLTGSGQFCPMNTQLLRICNEMMECDCTKGYTNEGSAGGP